jgi:hypothetical protein
MSTFIAPTDYFKRYYSADLKVFGGEMMCGASLTDSLCPPKRARFKGLAEFVVCQFELNLLSQAMYTHMRPAYWAWHAFSAPFVDPRLCYLGHGMGNHMPYSILRFAQQPFASDLRFAQLPFAAPKASMDRLDWDITDNVTNSHGALGGGTPPVALSWNIIRTYTVFFFEDYLTGFEGTGRRAGYSRQSLLQALARDQDCTACVLTATGWESKHVLELLEHEQTRD